MITIAWFLLRILQSIGSYKMNDNNISDHNKQLLLHYRKKSFNVFRQQSYHCSIGNILKCEYFECHWQRFVGPPMVWKRRAQDAGWPRWHQLTLLTQELLHPLVRHHDLGHHKPDFLSRSQNSFCFDKIKTLFKYITLFS